MARRYSWIISLSILFLCLSVVVLNTQFVSELRNRAFDWFQILAPRPYVQQPVTIIDIDDESLAKLGQWPWSRDRLAELTRQLHNAGAAAIVWDIVFAEADESSPHLYIPKHMPALSTNDAAQQNYDLQFAEMMHTTESNITGFVLTTGTTAKPPRSAASFAVLGSDAALVQSQLNEFSSAVTTLPALEEAAAGNGALNNIPDRDGVIRRIPLVYNLNGQMVPSLAAEALRVAQGAGNYILRSDQETGAITDIKIGNAVIPTTKAGELWLYYTDYTPERYIPVWKALAGDMEAERIAGHIVLIGTSAAGLKDIRATPLNPAAPGVEVHAQALEQIFLGNYLLRPDWVYGLEIVVIAVTGLVLITLIYTFSMVFSSLLTAIMFAGCLLIPFYYFKYEALLIDPVMPSFTVAALYIVSSLLKYLSMEQEKKHIKLAFGQYISKEMVEILAQEPDRLKLGGEMKPITVMFCDIRGFTSISERYNAEELTQFINSFLTPMTDVIMRNHGTIDKYIGDCIMTFWNAPLDRPAHAQEACLAALEMQKTVQQFNAENAAKDPNYIPVQVGIGINTGMCCVGNMGSAQRFDYSVLGDDVNLASRLEGQCKTYDVPVIIGDETQKNLTSMATLPLDAIRVKGKQQAIQIYTMLGGKEVAQQPIFLELQATVKVMMESYKQQQWMQAMEHLTRARHLYASLSDVPALETLFTLYEKRIAHYEQNPPAVDWDGVYTAESK